MTSESDRDTFVDRVTRWLMPKDETLAAEACESMGLDGVYEGSSQRIQRLVRLAYARGCRRGASAAWASQQAVVLRATSPLGAVVDLLTACCAAVEEVGPWGDDDGATLARICDNCGGGSAEAVADPTLAHFEDCPFGLARAWLASLGSTDMPVHWMDDHEQPACGPVLPFGPNMVTSNRSKVNCPACRQWMEQSPADEPAEALVKWLRLQALMLEAGEVSAPVPPAHLREAADLIVKLKVRWSTTIAWRTKTRAPSSGRPGDQGGEPDDA